MDILHVHEIHWILSIVKQTILKYALHMNANASNNFNENQIKITILNCNQGIETNVTQTKLSIKVINNANNL